MILLLWGLLAVFEGRNLRTRLKAAVQEGPGQAHCGRRRGARGPTACRLSLTVSEGEGRHAGRDLHLDIDGSDLDALERYRGDALDHVPPRLPAQ